MQNKNKISCQNTVQLVNPTQQLQLLQTTSLDVTMSMTFTPITSTWGSTNMSAGSVRFDGVNKVTCRSLRQKVSLKVLRLKYQKRSFDGQTLTTVSNRKRTGSTTSVTTRSTATVMQTCLSAANPDKAKLKWKYYSTRDCWFLLFFFSEHKSK